MINIKMKDLKQTSKLWCSKRIKSFSENDLYCISPNVIFENLYYEKMDGLLELLGDNNFHYTKIYKDLELNGWDKKYPAGIGIGDRGEIFIHGGNHRMNILTKLNLDFVIFKFVYQKNLVKHIPVFLDTGENFYPDGLLPKWKKT